MGQAVPGAAAPLCSIWAPTTVGAGVAWAERPCGRRSRQRVSTIYCRANLGAWRIAHFGSHSRIWRLGLQDFRRCLRAPLRLIAGHVHDVRLCMPAPKCAHIESYGLTLRYPSPMPSPRVQAG